MDKIESEWNNLENELQKFQLNHKEYVKKLEEVENMKKTYLQQFTKLKKNLNSLNQSIEKLEKKNDELKPVVNENQESLEPVEKSNTEKIKEKLTENLNYMRQISDTFPRANGIYLRVILGSICVSILNKEEKWKYKEEYEKFKYTITLVSMVFSFFLLFIQSYRVLDAIFNFLLVWYYCTLTIRESILVVNGSQIKGWWQAHHFITTVCTAILLIWPDSESYHSFRYQFIWFSFYLSFVQLLQYNYQKGVLYRLRALGVKQDMDTTMEGFQSWMLRGLGFLLPFLLFAYLWQFYNSYTLFILARSDKCNEWHVQALSIIFFILFAGNTHTTYLVFRKKFRTSIKDNLNYVKNKYNDWKNLRIPNEQLSEKNDKSE